MSAPPRVMVLTPQPFLEWRGSPLRVNGTVHALAELGLTVDLLALPFGQTPDLPPGVSVHRPPNLFRRASIPIGPSAWKLVYDVLLARLAVRLATRQPYAVFHGIEEAGWLAVRLARRHGARAIYEKHSDPVSHRGGAFKNLALHGYARLEAHMARTADLVIATGPGLARQVQRLAPAAPVHTIFDVPSSRAEPAPERVAALRERFCPDPGQRLAAYAGSFAAYQGLDLLFAAWPEIVRQFPTARALIIGGSPPEIAARRATLAAQGLAASVHFVGPVPPDELPDYLAAADVLLSPRGAGVNTPLKILD
ncbi:MAG: glycosyltransferase, partial [Candidatus Marinimicrobia bacterium]|nr:glycosyltransferase [Candidatus Neomarinimicrobiota bacterium]